MKIFANFYTSPTAAATRLAQGISVPIHKRDGVTLLCMNRAVLSSDIAAMESRTGFQYALVSAAAFEALLARCVQEAMQVQTFFTRTYLELPEDIREKLKAITRQFLDACAMRFPFHAVMVGNADYWQDEPLKDICRERGIPFIVLCRENYVVTYEQYLLRKRIAESGFTFRGTANAVASETTRSTMLSTPAYAEDQIHVVGWPRFDGWIDEPAISAGHDILLVAYQQKSYLAPDNFVDVLKCFVAMARKSGQARRFCIKLKKTSHIKNLLMACPSLLFSGVRMVANTSLEQLIRSSSMVIGYNTTGMLEAYLSPAAVVVPWWKDAVRSGESNLIGDDNAQDRATTNFPKSSDELGKLITQSLDGQLPKKGTPEQRLGQFQRYIKHDPQETASIRFEKLVLECLKKSTPKSQG
jgi:hypothetical protein